MINLMCGDCLELMKTIPDSSVDLILTDPPYGTVKNIGDSKSIKHGMKNKTKWDETLDFNLMWSEINRILRKNGKCILFSQEPFTSELIRSRVSNIPFSYRCIWLKDHFANSLIAKKAPVNYFEDICIFSKDYIQQKNYDPNNEAYEYLKSQRILTGLSIKELNVLSSKYQNKIVNPHRNILARSWETSQFMIPSEDIYVNVLQKTGFFQMEYSSLLEMNSKNEAVFNLPENKKFKSNIFEYKKDYSGLHPTQKPVALLEDLIKTYSNSGDTVLDFTMGSGSTGVACINTNRNFIGIELDEKYFEVAKNRINSL